MPDPFNDIVSGFVLLTQSDVDTDQIYPARFMTTISRERQADALFYDARRDSNGSLRADHSLNIATPEQCILVAGANFGTGSSREHAVWALMDHGFRAILAPSFADIFQANALNNGLLAAEIPLSFFDALAACPHETLRVELREQLVSGHSVGRVTFEIEPFAKHCLVHGVDRLGFLLGALPDIETHEITHGLGSVRLFTQ